MPNKEELQIYTHQLEAAANHYQVSMRTIRRWLLQQGIYCPRKGYGPGKLDTTRASEIRRLYRTDKYTQAQLAGMFAVTQANRKMTEVKEYARAPMGPNHFTVDSDGKAYMAGWYSSSNYFSTSENSCQLLQLDHPDLLLGATPLAIKKDKPKLAQSQRAKTFVQLPGVPVGYFRALDAKGREYRTYSGARSRLGFQR